MLIRPATAAELPALQDIERAAGEPFRALGMAAIADDEPPTVEELDRYRLAGRAWVAVCDGEGGGGDGGGEGDGSPAAYLLADPLPDADALHIEQVTVRPQALGSARAGETPFAPPAAASAAH